jgi:hypothetical protein
MIKELELLMSDPVVCHFKKLFEMNEEIHRLRPNKINKYEIQKNPKK